MLPFVTLLLKGRDGQTWKNHVYNCALCHLQHVDGQIDPFLVIIPYWITLYVMWAIYKGCHEVEL